jgi:hypothetical protein
MFSRIQQSPEPGWLASELLGRDYAAAMRAMSVIYMGVRNGSMDRGYMDALLMALRRDVGQRKTGEQAGST